MIKNFLTTRLLLKIVALFLAIATWVYVNFELKP